MIVKYQNSDYGLQYVRTGLLQGQQLLSSILQNSRTHLESIDEETCTIDELIIFGDHHRHRQDYTRAQMYYSKALDKTTEINAKHVWNIYRKMIRMKIDEYQGYFIVLYSKYDDDNPKHFQIIHTLQIIMYKLCLSQNEYELPFKCLIQGFL